MNNSFNAFASLSRSHTPNGLSNSTTRASPSPKCFGKNTHVLKDDFEKEKARWHQKLEEAELKLNEASVNNSELFQVKAELNRKVLDLEKNQRPLIEQNRRLNDRIRLLHTETKKVEEKLRDAQEDYFNMRDAYDRIAKENSLLKEQRAFPEKLEELGRYRSQVLEYSKCITALRQSILEKDQRYELLIQKFKKFRKCLTAKRATTTGDDEDKQSCIGSEGSLEDSVSIGLDTIAEDFDEDVSELLRTPMTPAEYSLKQQLDLANVTISELQNALELASVESSTKLSETLAHQHEELCELREHRRRLETELANLKDNNDLLEFQLVELTEVSQKRSADISDKNCSTELELPCEHESEMVELELMAIESPLTLQTAEYVEQTRTSLYQLLCKVPTLLSKVESQFVKGGIEVIDSMQKHIAMQDTELNMARCELETVKLRGEEELRELRRKLDDELVARKLIKKKELQAEIDQLKKEKKEESKKNAKQIEELQDTLEEKIREIQERSQQVHQLNGELSMAKSESEIHFERIRSGEEAITELNRKVNKLTLDLATSNADIDAYKEKLKDVGERFELERKKSEAELRSAKATISSHEQRIAHWEEEATTLGNTLEETTEMKAALERELARLNGELEHAQAALAQQKELSMQLVGEREALKDQLSRVHAELEHIEGERDQLAGKVGDCDLEIATLREQVEQLERRCDEPRYRLANSLKKGYALEEELKVAKEKIAGLEEEISTQLHKTHQLQTYNHELEEQFNAQVEMFAALRKEFAILKGNANSIESIGWTSNSSEGVNSLEEDRHYPMNHAPPPQPHHQQPKMKSAKRSFFKSS